MKEDLVRLIRGIVEPEVERALRTVEDAVIDAVEGSYASVGIGDPSSAPLPGFYVSPSLAVQSGDHVLVLRRGGYQVVLEVLSRNGREARRVGQPDSPEAAADYLARIKRAADEKYRLTLGVSAAGLPFLALGPGGTTDTDVILSRNAADTLHLADGDTLDVGSLRVRDSGTWTPTVVPDTAGDWTPTYIQQVGRYVRVRGAQSFVFYTLLLNFTVAHATASGAVRVFGLPISVTAGPTINPLSLGRATYPTGTSYVQLWAETTSGGSMRMIACGSGIAEVGLGAGNFPSHATDQYLIRSSGIYVAAA